MPVTSVTKDPEALTMTMVGDFSVPVERLWAAYADPRQLERFWGPPGWPAQFLSHDFTAGGRAVYAMTGPGGERSAGYWEFLAIEEPSRIEVRDGFALDDGSPNPEMPSMRMVFEFTPTETGSRLTSTTYFDSADQLAQLLEMGMEQGATLAMGQIDRVLEDLRETVQGKGVLTEVMDDVHVRFLRFIDAPRALVWRAFIEPELVQQWLLGPDGWAMTVCEIDATAGGAYRYRWEPAGAEGEAFGFEGVNALVEAPFRVVQTEAMTGAPFPPNTNDLTLVEADGGTLMTLIVTYPSVEQRDMILATGMTTGMEASYARLERQLAG